MKLIDGVQCAWCGTCHRWTKGDKMHLTNEHKRKDGSKPAPVSSANLAADAGFSGGLQLVSGFL